MLRLETGGKKGSSSNDYSGKGKGKGGKKGDSSDDYGKGGKKGSSSDHYGGRGKGKEGKKGTMTGQGGNSDNSGKGSTYIRRLGGSYSVEDNSDHHVECHQGKGAGE